ncbi:MAG TPA: Hsp70 family protein [Bacteriovoracaceae bacterium]|nr:Hsp70 family protein [Bacteriovoracaceae bacterium]
MSYYAIDFGTSNSLLSYVSSTGEITPVPLEGQSGFVLRSLFYTPEQNKWYFGNEAIAEYSNHAGEGRFFRSIKKFLPEPTYTGTTVFNKTMPITEMIAVFLREMRLRADKFTGVQVEKLVLGRPALYSLEKDQDKLAEDRMRKGSEIAGFKQVVFCPEPIAAGLDYSAGSKKEKIVLIADFGGGTSDFTLMKFHAGAYSEKDILGLSGVFTAGDALDGVMMRDFIAPHFGSRFEYQLPGGSNVLKFPKNLLKKICSPAHITHLKEKDTWEFLQNIKKFALTAGDDHRMQQLMTLVECQLGFPLFNEIEKTKISLGKADVADFSYRYPGIEIDQPVEKLRYEEGLRSTIQEVDDAMMDVFAQSGLTPQDVDQVCLTGGTSQFPLIRKKIETTFGKNKLYDHNIYQSVVSGLALYAKKLI